MRANKKIINATPNQLDSIKFKSRSEALCYKRLIESGFSPKYEEESFVLFNTYKLRDSSLLVFIGDAKSKTLERFDKTLRKSVYTPDFTFDYKNFHVIIEIKGFSNDVWPLKRKLFLSNLQAGLYPINKTVLFFEIHSIRELVQAIKIIKGEESGL